MATNELSPAEKLDIINTHLRNIQYSEYNTQLNLIEEQATSNPSDSAVESYQNELAQLAAKKTAVLAEQAKYTQE
jgi:hypothetical protein